MSHILAEITIKNYKSIKDYSFELTSYTPLVGYNNAGKSNILEAIVWLLRKSTLTEAAFNDISQPVEVIGKITGVSEDILRAMPTNQRNKIESYINNGIIYIKRTQPSPSCVATDVKLYIKNPAPENPDVPWDINPTGIEQAIQKLYPEPIYIQAMQDSSEDISKNKTTTSIGRLLIKIFGTIQDNYNEQVQTAFDAIKKLLDADGEERITEFIDFDRTVNEKVSSFFPGITVKVHVPAPDLKDVYSKSTIKIYEALDGEGKDVNCMGHGTQRSIQMALVRHLADLKREAEGDISNTLLLIDEPELYLHPQAIEILRDALKKLSTQGFQIIFSTHSANTIIKDDMGNTLLIRKDGVRGTYQRTTLHNAIPSVEADAPAQLALLFSLSNSSNILFSEKVVLAEGTTEKRLLPELVIKVTGKTLGLHKAAQVSMGGSTNTKKSKQVLEMMDLPTKAILDLDYALTKGEIDGYLVPGDSDVNAIKTHLACIAVQNNITLGTNGWPTKTTTMTAAEAFSILAREATIQQNIENIKSKMLTHNVWIWKKGTIEDHLGGIPKNEHGWHAFNQRLKNEELTAILPNDYQEIVDLITWMIN